jgi:hypothetical protein
MIIVVLVLALGYFALDKFVLTARREAARVSSAVPNELKSVINKNQSRCCRLRTSAATKRTPILLTACRMKS